MTPLYVLRRFGRALVTILMLVTFVFVILRLSGDPAQLMLGPEVEPEALEAFRVRWGLDRSIPEQFWIYLTHLAQGDWGRSFTGDRAVWDVVSERIPRTLLLMGLTALIAVVVGIGAGIYAALHHDSLADRFTMGVAVASFSLPNFVVGIVLIMVFAVFFRVLPTSGWGDWKHLVLPVLTMATADAAVFARFARSSMLEVLNAPFIRTAQAKGVPWGKVIRSHALPNASIPLVTIGGFYLGGLIAGATVTESVFAWPGIGHLFVSAVASRDMAVVQAIVIMIGITMVISNLLVDLAYGWIDPRTRNEAGQ